MLRIVWIILHGLLGMPAIIIKTLKLRNREEATLEERYQYEQYVVDFILRHGNIHPIITGTENLPKEPGYLITPNHQGLIDPVLIAKTCPCFVTAVGKLELTNIILLKDFMKCLKAFAMDRDDLRQSMKVIKEVSVGLQQGMNVMIFPEGTRSRKGNVMGEFKAGSFKAAVNAKAPIVPTCMIDCFKVLDKNSIKKIEPQLHYLPAIYYEEYQDLTTSEIAELVKSRIQAKMDEILN